MEYQVEELSSVEVKINVQLTAAEVDQALTKATNKLKKDIAIDGYRKGKVPNSVLLKRHFDEIANEALNTTINNNVDTILDKIDYFPANNAKFEGDMIAPATHFEYSLILDVLPKLDLPDLSKISVTEQKAIVEASEVDELVTNIQNSMARPVPLLEERPAQNGDLIVLSFKGIENGQVVEGLEAEFYTIKLGQQDAPEDFEKLILGLSKGEKNSGPVYFAEDFPAKEIAGHNINISLEVHDIQAQELPPLGDEIAQVNGFDTLALMREEIEKNILVRKERDYKITTIDKMMTQILEPMSFEIPKILLERQKRDFILAEKRRLELEGRTEEEVQVELAKLVPTADEKSMRTAKAQVLLLIYAFREKMTVSEREIDMRIYQQAQYAGEDFQKLRNIVWQSEMANELRDKILCDKAMDYIYNQVNKVSA